MKSIHTVRAEQFAALCRHRTRQTNITRELSKSMSNARRRKLRAELVEVIAAADEAERRVAYIDRLLSRKLGVVA